MGISGFTEFRRDYLPEFLPFAVHCHAKGGTARGVRANKNVFGGFDSDLHERLGVNEWQMITLQRVFNVYFPIRLNVVTVPIQFPSQGMADLFERAMELGQIVLQGRAGELSPDKNQLPAGVHSITVQSEFPDP